MKKRISRVSPLQLGIVFGLLYGILALIFVPFVIIASILGHGGIGIVFAIFLPIMYAIVGFIAGVITALVYNLVAMWTGGIEFTLTDVP